MVLISWGWPGRRGGARLFSPHPARETGRIMRGKAFPGG
jgi:hypothetical protein